MIWHRAAWIDCAARYYRLALLCSTPAVMVALARLVDMRHGELFCESIVGITNVTGNIPALLHAMIFDEVRRSTAAANKGSLLRGNSIANRLQSSFVRVTAKDFLRQLLGPLISELLAVPDLSLEVDPSKVEVVRSLSSASAARGLGVLVDGEVTTAARVTSTFFSLAVSRHRTNSVSCRDSIQSSSLSSTSLSSTSSADLGEEYAETTTAAADHDVVLRANQRLLLDISRVFLDRICARHTFEALPSQLKIMASLTAAAAREYQPDMARSLLGGFLMLRVIAPALVAPEKCSITSNISSSGRRNLILVAKILQNTANNVEFGDKETWMAFANPFLRESFPKFNNFLDLIAESLPDMPPSSNTEPFDVQQIDIQDLFVVHDTLFRHNDALLAELADTTTLNPAEQQELSEFVNSLGPSPYSLLSDSLSRSTLTAKERKEQYNQLRKSSAQMSSMSPTSPSPEDTSRPLSSQATMLLSPPTFEQPALSPESIADTMFFFNGRPTLDGMTSLYLILNRIQPSFFQSVDAIISHIYRVLERIGDRRYVLVVDLSWTLFSDEMKKGLRVYVEQLRTLFSHRYKKNLDSVYLVHPSPQTRGLIMLVRAFSSIKLSVKIKETYNWQDLLKVFAPEDILLPESSKSTITKAFHVKKVNAHGKQQRRLIKFTVNSLLNIDPSGARIKNEKLLSDIDFVSAVTEGQPSITLRFAPEARDDALAPLRRITFRQKLARTSPKDRVERVYLVESVADQHAIIDEIFRAGFHLSSIGGLPQEYLVTKVNVAGKGQNRIFKLTGDSLLNLDRRCRIRDEISYAGIETVEPDALDTQIIWLKKKTDPQPRKIICPEAFSLYRVLKSMMDRYTAENVLLLRTLQR